MAGVVAHTPNPIAIKAGVKGRNSLAPSSMHARFSRPPVFHMVISPVPITCPSASRRNGLRKAIWTRRCSLPDSEWIRSGNWEHQWRSTSWKFPRFVVVKINDAAIVPAVIPARTYEGQTKNVETAAIVNFLVTREGVSADTVYAMTRAIFNNLTQLVQTHPAASGISLKDAVVAMPVPLHPGAERYYREMGVLR